MNVLYQHATPNPAGYRDVDPALVAEAMGKVRAIDVREASELEAELGHVRGIEHVPLGNVPAVASTWDKDEEIVLICRSGARSGRAAALLASMGFRRVLNMRGGMLAWSEARLPVRH